jgi:hypothetical protein
MSKEKKNSIDSLYEQTMLIAKQVEQLKKEVMGEQTYSFTKQQLKEFSDSLYDNFVQFQNSSISGIEFSSDYVQLELEDNVIVASIDSTGISDEIESLVEPPSTYEMDNMISEILESMKIELQ